ncbi:MAG TPA: hypothetical protein VFQ44_30525 [Streptosporangiaceae bacterium]|nr:hypothetical protein [Streptosporangiaceae bacterium]
MSLMIWRLLRLGVPVGGLQLALAGGAAYFAWEHDQGRHDHAHPLCAICWLDKIAPEPSGGTRTQAAPQE